MKLSLDDQARYWNDRAILDKGVTASLWHGRTVWNLYHHYIQELSLNKYFLKIKRGQSVLDVGCGVGRWTRFMSKGRVTGIDIAPAAITRCRQSAPSGSMFVVMSATDMKLSSNSFDWVFSIASLCCITDKIQFEKAVSECMRVLKPTGTAVFLEHLDNNTKANNIINLWYFDMAVMLQKYGAEHIECYGVDNPRTRNFLEKLLQVVPGRFLREVMTALYIIPIFFIEIFWTPLSKANYVLIVVKKDVK